ncbi:HNH endonuclease [Pseudomonas segetis]
MARARNIKPAFFKNEELADSSFETRLLFIGLWTLADREGRLEDRPRRIRAEIFPFDGIDVEPMMAELERLSFLDRYEVDGEKFVQITNFVKHQDPHYREKASDIPPMPGSENQILATGVTRTQRARILKRDGYKCQYCGSTEHPCIDHVIPVSRGGDSSDDNLQVLCLPCNTKKGNKIDSTLNQGRSDVDSTVERDVPLIPDSLIPDSLIPDSLSSDSLIPDSSSQAPSCDSAQSDKTKSKKPNPANPSAKFDPLDHCPGNVSAEVWAKWVRCRKEQGKPLKQTTCEAQAKQLEGISNADSVVEKSIAAGWQGLFPEKLKDNIHQFPTSNHTGFDKRDYSAGLVQREDGTYGLA